MYQAKQITMKTLFNNEEFNLTFSIDLTDGIEVLKAKLKNWIETKGEEAFADREMWLEFSVDILDEVIVFWGANGCLGFEKVNFTSL